MSSKEAADAFGINQRTVSKWLEESKLSGGKENGRVFVLVDPNDDRLVIKIGNNAEGEPSPSSDPEPVHHDVQVIPPPSIDLSDAVDLIERLSDRVAELSAASAMWQERASGLQTRYDELASRHAETVALLEAGPIEPPKPKRGFWARLFLGPDPDY